MANRFMALDIEGFDSEKIHIPAVKTVDVSDKKKVQQASKRSGKDAKKPVEKRAEKVAAEKKPDKDEEVKNDEKGEILYISKMKIQPLLSQIVTSITEKQVTSVSAGTGSGKTVAIPRMILEDMLNGGDLSGYTVLVSIPTVINVVFQHKFALDNNKKIEEEFARACGGKKSGNFHTAKVVYATTQTVCNYVSDLYCKKSLKLNKLIVMIDEAHHPSQENYVLHGLCNWLIEKGYTLKVVVATATPSEHPFKHLNVIPVTLGDTQFPVKYNWPDVGTVSYSRMAGTDVDKNKLMGDIMKKIDEVKKIVSGHILVFVSGENDVESLCESLSRMNPDCAIYPLYSSLPEDEICAVCEVSDKRKIIVSTNVAESGVTIPDVEAVIDSMLHKKMSMVKGSRIISECVISQASSTQRAGRAGRTCAGYYFPMMDKHTFDQLPRYIENEFMLLPKHIPVINLINKGLPAQEVLMIPVKEYTELMGELLSMGLVSLEGDHYIVTDLGMQVSKYPLSIRATSCILNALKKLNVSKKDFVDRSENFSKLLHFVIGVIVAETYSSCPHVFDVPREERKNRNAFIHGGTFDDFKQDDDISVFISVFCNMMADNYNARTGRTDFKKWCKSFNINTKFMEMCYRLFNQVWYIVFDFAEKKVNTMYTQDFETIIANLDDYKDDMYAIMASVYADRVFVLSQRFPRLAYTSVKEGGMYSVDNGSISQMWRSGASTIIALSETTINVPGKRSFTIINMCFPLAGYKRPGDGDGDVDDDDDDD